MGSGRFTLLSIGDNTRPVKSKIAPIDIWQTWIKFATRPAADRPVMGTARQLTGVMNPWASLCYRQPQCARECPPMRRRYLLIPFLLSLCSAGHVLGQDVAQESARWSITPYLWATDTTVDLSFRDQSLGGGEITFDDLLDQLDSACEMVIPPDA